MTIDVAALYRDLHTHPELSLAEHRTARVVAEALRELGIETTAGVGGTGVVGRLSNGPGPAVLLRADMDALPVLEDTGLPYASRDRGIAPDGADVPVMHACGHDVHVACLLGAAERLVRTREEWSGTAVFVFQPAEEFGDGAARMIADPRFAGLPRPDVVLGQHVTPHPAGTIGLHPGPAWAATDDVLVTLHGRGGHGSRPESTVDPVVMAAAVVTRLQTIVSREVGADETAVLTVGAMQAGTKTNVIPDEARLGINLRTYDRATRDRLIAAVHRVVRAEADASGAPRPPDIAVADSLPVTINEPAATADVAAAFRSRFGADHVFDPGRDPGSEDVSRFATTAGAPLVYWMLGGGDPGRYAAAPAAGTIERDVPWNHSPKFAPLPDPTLDIGVEALVTAARVWLSAAARHA